MTDTTDAKAVREPLRVVIETGEVHVALKTGEISVALNSNPYEFAHEALLKEMHKADDLAETHSTLVVTISGAAFAFAATQLQNSYIVMAVAFFGLLVALEWLFKIHRHQQIFSAARSH
jgi:hypothetical protein